MQGQGRSEGKTKGCRNGQRPVRLQVFFRREEAECWIGNLRFLHAEIANGIKGVECGDTFFNSVRFCFSRSVFAPRSQRLSTSGLTR